MKGTLLLCVLVIVIYQCSTVRAQDPPPPNATACTIGTSKCNGADNNCVCQHNGICQGPDYVTCSCPSPDVWGGNYCHEPRCVGPNFPNGCVNGDCVNPGSCQCRPGWKGYDCTIPLPCSSGDSCLPGTPCACLNNGTCGGPTNSVCTCKTGWASDYCEVVVCSGPDFPGGCQQGRCVSPNVCQCNPGWNGTDCSKPICDPPCANGKCTSPNTCDCFGTGYAHCPNAPAICGCDENECQRGEKPCDTPTVQCNNYIGSFNCTACPPGSQGTPYLYYPLSPQNKTYYVGGCNNPPPTTGVMPTEAQQTTQQTTGEATTGQAASQATTVQSTTGQATDAPSVELSSQLFSSSMQSSTEAETNSATQQQSSATTQLSSQSTQSDHVVEDSGFQYLTPTILGCAVVALAA